MRRKLSATRGLRNDILKGFLETAMDPAEVALHVRDAIVEDRFWITTHPEFFTAVTQRADDIVTGRNPIPEHLRVAIGLT